MAVHEFGELRSHVNHEIECVTYGDGDGGVANVALECVTCSEVLLDFDNPGDPPKVVRYEDKPTIMGEDRPGLDIVYDDGSSVSIIWHAYAYAGEGTVEIAQVVNDQVQEPDGWVPVEEIPLYLR